MGRVTVMTLCTVLVDFSRRKCESGGWSSAEPGPSAMARNTQNCRRSERKRNLGGRSGRFLSYLYGQPLELGFLVCSDGAA